MDEKLRARAAKVRAVAEDSRVPDGLREAARDRLAALEERHGPLPREVPPPRQPAIGRRVLGEKAEATWDLPTGDVAALIKAEIRAARQPAPRGAAPDAVARHNPIRDAPKGTRITVHHRQFTGNCAIDVTIRGVPLDWAVDGVEEVGPGRTRRRLSEPCGALVDAVTAISDAYNWRGDNTLVHDFVDVRFYSHVNLYTACGEHLVT
ncbi:hypothetical protein ACIOGZ_41280 [Kitasatospora sp. NPDC088160]|uniref:hypothetical protein n=1 Tax=Kitasatospora sp. NPDC088160 TaxID=3364072 RepID=UPI00381C88D1